MADEEELLSRGLDIIKLGKADRAAFAKGSGG
jgi:hypothetical protein